MANSKTATGPNRMATVGRAAQQAVEDRRPHLVATVTVVLAPVVKYHGLARRHLTALGFLMRPLLNGGTLGRRVAGDWRLETGMDDLARPMFIGAVTGVAAMAFTPVLGYLTARAFLLGGQDICPEGMCGIWMLLGLWGAGPALPICGIAAGVAARSAANDPRASKSLVWRSALLAATIAWSVTAAVGLAWFYTKTGNLPPGPQNLFSVWFRG